MLKIKFTKKNLDNIKVGFYKKRGGEPIKRRFPIERYVAASVVAMGFTIGVLASAQVIDMSAVYRNFLGIESENVGFTINRTCESQGIQLTLLSAITDGNAAYIFFTMQDLMGDRLTPGKIGYGTNRVDFVNSGFFKGYLLGGSIDEIDYDQSSKTLTAVMHVHSTKGISQNDKISFRMNQLESGVTHYSDFDTGVDLYAAASCEAQATTEYWNEINSQGYSDEKYDFSKKQIKDLNLLLKNNYDIAMPGIDWAIISNIGFIDGMLHIQYQYTENRTHYNDGYLSIYDKDGNEIPHLYSVGMGVYPTGYDEYVYDISSPEQLKDVSLKAYFTTSEIHVDGVWQLDFYVDSQLEEKSIKISNRYLQNIYDITVASSPIGTTIKYKANKSLDTSTEFWVKFEQNCFLKLADDTLIPLKMHAGSFDRETGNGDIHYKNNFFEIDSLAAIIIDGTEYPFGN